MSIVPIANGMGYPGATPPYNGYRPPVFKVENPKLPDIPPPWKAAPYLYFPCNNGQQLPVSSPQPKGISSLPGSNAPAAPPQTSPLTFMVRQTVDLNQNFPNYPVSNSANYPPQQAFNKQFPSQAQGSASSSAQNIPSQGQTPTQYPTQNTPTQEQTPTQYPTQNTPTQGQNSAQYPTQNTPTQGQNPTQNPTNPNENSPPPQEKKVAKPENPSEQNAEGKTDADGKKDEVTGLSNSKLDSQTITDLNNRLNDNNDQAREKAAVKLVNLLQAHPDWANEPGTKSTVDAFLTKLLVDPDMLVRIMGETFLQTGKDKQPSSDVMNALRGISQHPDDLTHEDTLANGLLKSLKKTGGANPQNIQLQGYGNNPFWKKPPSSSKSSFTAPKQAYPKDILLSNQTLPPQARQQAAGKPNPFQTIPAA